MDAITMQSAFERRIHQLGKSIGRIFLSSDIEDFLNEAQKIIYLESYSRFEQDEMNRKILSALIGKHSTISFNPTVANFENGYVIAMPSNFQYALEEHAVYGGNIIKVKPITYDQYTANIFNPFKKPYSDLIWRLNFQSDTDQIKNHELVTDGQEVLSRYQCMYLEALEDISINENNTSLLDEIVHNRIVDTAIGLAVRSLPQTSDSNKKSE